MRKHDRLESMSALHEALIMRTEAFENDKPYKWEKIRIRGHRANYQSIISSNASADLAKLAVDRVVLRGHHGVCGLSRFRAFDSVINSHLR